MEKVEHTLHLESVIGDRFVYSLLCNSIGLTSIFSFGNRKSETECALIVHHHHLPPHHSHNFFTLLSQLTH